MLENKTVLITGGTGSFGRHFVQELLSRHAPERVVVFSRDELKQYQMAQAIEDPRLQFLIGDVRDAARLREVTTGVQVVVHAAALKHVLTAERNPMECIKTNVHGADHLISAARASGVERVIALSTDKAANPVSVYGASKLAADKLFVAANNHPAKGTRYAVVRYGNMVGASGSVVPRFRELLAQGVDSLPITDPRMTRFWLTPEMAVAFVLRSLQRMQGGEIFVPRVPSIRITDLAEAMAPGLPTRVIGRRAGEKLHEVMCPAEESHLTLAFADHFVIRPSSGSATAPDYALNACQERGRPVEEGFAYTSSRNPEFLSLQAIREWNARSQAAQDQT